MKLILEDSLKNYKVLFKRLTYLLSMVACGLLYSLINNPRGHTYSVMLPIDNAIPFNKYFIIPYIIWYGYVFCPLYFYALYDEKRYIKLILSLVTGMLIAFAIYLIYPTITPRPELVGKDIFTQLVRAIYANDNPYNCFPSLHVFESVIIAMFINRDSRFKLATKRNSTIMCVLIILSTCFVKQHYVLDGVAGIFLAYIVYYSYNFNEVRAFILGRFPVLHGVKGKI